MRFDVVPYLSCRRFRPPTGVVAAAMLLVGLAACGEGVTAPEVATEMPATWREAPGASTAEIGADWVGDFGSAELTRLVGLADLDNLDVVAARARIDQAEGQLAVARAGLAPTVSGSGDATRTATPGTTSSSSPPFHTRVGNSFQLGVAASWQVDLWGRVAAGVAAGEASVAASRDDLAAVRLSTATAIAEAYVQAAAAQDRLRLAHDNITIAERTLAAIRRRFDVGTVTALDVAQQESVVAAQRADVPDLEITLRQTRNALAVLAGRPPEALTVRVGGLATLRLPRIAPGIPSRLLVRRPDVVAAERRLAAAAANVEAARAAFLPQVSLTGSGGVASAFLKNLLRPEALAASIGASVTDTIFDGGAREGALALARGSHAELAAGYRKAVHQALADVENALIAVEQDRRHEALQEAVVTAARRVQTLTERQLAEGTIAITTVLDAERTLFQAEDTRVTVRSARFQAAIRLVAALGGGWTAPEPAIATTSAAAAADPMALRRTDPTP